MKKRSAKETAERAGAEGVTEEHSEGPAELVAERGQQLRMPQEEMARSHRLLLALARAAQAVQHARTPVEVYHAVGKEVVRLGYHAIVFTLTGEPRHLVISHLTFDLHRLRSAEKLASISGLGHRFPVARGGIYDQVITSGQAIFLERAVESIGEALPKPVRPLTGRLAAMLGLEQSILVPLTVDGEVHGLMIVTGTGLTEADMPAVVVFANQTAIALENARLQERAQREIAERKQAEEKLRDSEEQYRVLVENQGEGIGIVDVEKRFTFANPAAHDIFGVPQGSLVGRALSEFTDAGNWESVVAQTGRRRAGQTSVYELDILRPDGQRRSLLVTTTPRFDHEGQFAGSFGVFRDVTDRVRAEEALHRERNLLRTLIDSMPDLIYVKDAESRFVLNNDAHLRVLGAAAQEEVLDKTDLDIFPPELAARYYADEQAVLQTGERIVDREEPYQDPEGDMRWLSTTKVPLRDRQGQVVGLVGISRDITARIQVEDVLRASEERYHTLTGAAQDAIIAIDPEGTISYWNTAAVRTFGYTEQEAIGQDLHALLVPEHYRAAFRRGFSAFGNSGLGVVVGQTLALTALRQNGVVFPAELSLSAFSVRGRWHAIGIVRDISERVRIEEALRAYSERLEEMVEERTQALQEAHEQLLRREKLAALGQLAGSVAHDLRNPLGAIKNTAYLLRLILEEPEGAVKEALDVLGKEVQTAEQIISSLLDFARTKALDRRAVSVNLVVQEALSRISLPDTPRVEVVCQLDETLPTILADPDQLGRVYSNLILNAIQAMPDGGRLTVSSRGDPGGHPEWMIVSVSDTGVGIPEENLPKLFEPLYTTKANGTGLGLALVKDLVAGHGGTVEAESDGVPGKGSTFSVRLPIDQGLALKVTNEKDK